LYTHLAAGVAGGALVLAGAYTWYHFSGLKNYVEAGKNAKERFNKAAQTLSENAKKHPSQALKYLRNIAKSYAAVIPGASSYVDEAFDKLDEVHDTHREEVDAIVNSALDEISQVTADDASLKDTKTALKVVGIVREKLSQLSSVGIKAGGDALSPFIQKYPEVRGKLGDSYEQLKKAAQGKGADARALLEDTTDQIKDKLSNGITGESLDKARNLISARILKIRELPDRKSDHE